MATTITKEPSVETAFGTYPAFNNSFLEFSSDLLGNNKAEITMTPSELFPKVFVIYPDTNGIYLFNMKEAVKVAINQDGFKDSGVFDDAYFKPVPKNFLSQDISIEIFNDTTSEVLAKNYSFYKEVKQVGEKIFENGFSLLNRSKNGLDYSLTYFEGFPFFFEFKRIFFTESTDIKIRNKNTGQSVRTVLSGNGTFRCNVDLSGGENWTAGLLLPLNVGVNRLEVLTYDTEGESDNEVRVNIDLKKIKRPSGVYLKWRNTEGGFSHHLFEEYYTERISGKDIDIISSGEFDNVNDVTSDFRSIGKVAGGGLRVKAKLDKNEAEELKSLILSPFIQMYTSDKPNIKGEFIDVSVEGSLDYKNKKANQQIFLTIGLPEIQTLKL